ncbi:MAG TPA: hypothetical protein DDZ80_07350 [Cyanobacteria bacterium UBA8803]|nr:hypothetical protein [Cyanobacteria bacterium UBA8803]
MKGQTLTRFIPLTIGVSVSAGILLGLEWGIEAGMASAVIVLSMAISYCYPRAGLWMLLIYLPFGGSITYSIGDGYPLFHLIQDALFIPALIVLMQSRKSLEQFLRIIKPLLPTLWVLLAVSLVTLIFVNGVQQLQQEPPDHPLLIGILGFRVLMGHIPLMFGAYCLIRNQQDLLFLTRLQLILILICCSLGLVQYLLLVNGACPGSSHLEGYAVYKASLQARCLVGGSLLYNPELNLIRLPGTFVAPWQWGWFLISSSFIAYASRLKDPTKVWRLLSWVALLLILVMAVLSGQRIALAIVPTTLLFLIVLTDRPTGLVPIKLGLFVLFSLWIANNLVTLEERLESLIDRWNASPPHTFMVEQFKWVMKAQEGLLGNGLGRATNSARILGKTQLIETYYAKLLYEIGPIGVLAFLVMVSILSILTFKAYRSIQDRSLSRMGLCLWVFILFVSYNTYYPLSVDPVEVYYWFFAGVVLKLPELEAKKSKSGLGNRCLANAIKL